MSLYPMVDDRCATPSNHEVVDVGVWDRDVNLEAWALYLGTSGADAYAAPARADDLAGLPPTFIDVGEVDLFRDDDIALAARLLQAGVSTELHVYPGAYHASELIAPDATLSRTIWDTRLRALRQALFDEVRSPGSRDT
jgi:acetyl esterase/lipase